MKPDRSRNVFRYIAIRLGVILVVIIVVVGIILTRFPPSRTCTLIGCSSSLTLHFLHPLTFPYTLQLTVSNGESTSVNCTVMGFGETPAGGQISALCQASSVTINQFTPQQFTILVSWQGGSYTTMANPTYQTVQPNGPNCPPTCQQASWQLDLP
jgi:hypothetical protein